MKLLDRLQLKLLRLFPYFCQVEAYAWQVYHSAHYEGQTPQEYAREEGNVVLWLTAEDVIERNTKG